MSAGEDTSFARLVSLACHDLRTPLATVHGFARTLISRDDLGEPASRYVEIMAEATDQLTELLDVLALAARIEAGRYDPALQEVDTADLARVAAERLGADRASADGEGASVQVDRETAERVVHAFASCALRHGGLGSVQLTAQGPEVSVGPVAPAVSEIILGRNLRDLGAAVAVRAVAALGGSVALEGDSLLVRLPPARPTG